MAHPLTNGLLDTTPAADQLDFLEKAGTSSTSAENSVV